MEQADQAATREDVRRAAFRRAMARAGAVVQWPAGEPVPPDAYAPISIDGPPMFEQIIADRR
jgi:hypothetical protein